MVVGSYFVKDGEGFIRLNIGCPRATLNEALNRIKETYKKLYHNKFSVSMNINQIKKSCSSDIFHLDNSFFVDKKYNNRQNFYEN